ncbi:histidine kinase [Undibacterium jejuense]|uniref:Histidine kinase n=1 Tax=Undibacterium jejuense TaxID=1344949 RepID=A0A923HMA4_9BURK|nr:histidine kinase [Undibacterium jejuense]MBC3864332.1 histidine kinase [Undibacterium jejuense]
MKTKDENPVLHAVLNVAETVSVLWWKFFDWAAVVPWLSLGLTSFFAMIFAGFIGVGPFMVMMVLAAIVIKTVAGGKRKAELMASAAVTRADVESLERRLLEAEMAALQAQIEPHFLFNTLALIGQLMATDAGRAASVHADLIKYLRAALPQIRQQGIGQLGQQMALSRAYLNIMQARMQERLQYQIEVGEGLDQAQFPSMMIQTMVENAIKHGLEPKIEGGQICISAQRHDNELWVEVSDNGMGFDVHVAEGLGLTNIRERLKMLYGAKASLVIEVPFEGGARFRIQIPYLNQ